jgi:hypothetical protein
MIILISYLMIPIEWVPSGSVLSFGLPKPVPILVAHLLLNIKKK